MNEKWTLENIVKRVESCNLNALRETGLIFDFEVVSSEEGIGVLLIPIPSEPCILMVHGDYRNYDEHFSSHGNEEKLDYKNFLFLLDAQKDELKKALELYGQKKKWLALFSKKTIY